MSTRKSLKGYQLFLIGLATMLVGTYVIAKYVSEIGGGIFVFAGLFLWITAIVVSIKNIANRNNNKLSPLTLI
jgi:uncharacterized membrane protein YphA (DoxX/SURF4 family)